MDPFAVRLFPDTVAGVCAIYPEHVERNWDCRQRLDVASGSIHFCVGLDSVSALAAPVQPFRPMPQGPTSHREVWRYGDLPAHFLRFPHH
jgi:hypothetical protein